MNQTRVSTSWSCLISIILWPPNRNQKLLSVHRSGNLNSHSRCTEWNRLNISHAWISCLLSFGFTKVSSDFSGQFFSSRVFLSSPHRSKNPPSWWKLWKLERWCCCSPASTPAGRPLSWRWVVQDFFAWSWMGRWRSTLVSTCFPLQNYDDGSGDKQYGHALVAGIDRYPRRVTKTMGKKKIAKRSRIKPFLKVVNYNHVMPTRYVFFFKTFLFFF